MRRHKMLSLMVDILSVLLVSGLQVVGGEIHDAAKAGDVTRVEALLKSNSKLIESTDDLYGMTPLHWATFGGHIKLVEFLLSKGANVTAKSKIGIALLHRAVSEGNLKLMQMFLKDGADINVKDKEGMTPLHWAIKENNLAAAELLLSNNADVNATNEKGETPIVLAVKYQIIVQARHRNSDMEQLLLRHGAKKSEADDYRTSIAGTRELTWSIQRESDERERQEQAQRREDDARKQYVQYEEYKTAQRLAADALCSAVKAKDLLKVQALLSVNPILVKITDKDGGTPLHLAAVAGQREVAELLIAKGADVNASTRHGITPLHSAAYGGSKEVAELLLAHGASVYAKASDGSTPLGLASHGKNPELGLYLQKQMFARQFTDYSHCMESYTARYTEISIIELRSNAESYFTKQIRLTGFLGRRDDDQQYFYLRQGDREIYVDYGAVVIPEIRKAILELPNNFTREVTVWGVGVVRNDGSVCVALIGVCVK